MTSSLFINQFFTSQETLSGCGTDPASLSRLSLLLSHVSLPLSLSVPLPSLSPLSFSHPSHPPPLPLLSLPLALCGRQAWSE